MIGYLDKDYEQTKKTLLPMLKAGNITFDLLWALFKPNSIAYTTTYGAADHPRCFKVDLAYQDKSFARGEYYVVEGRYLEYDGKDYGLGDFEIHIDHFKGPRKIAALATYPIQYHKDEKNVRAELIDRGKKFVSLSGMNFKFMKGLAFQKRKKQLLKFNINGRVMVDPKTFRRVLANYMISSVKQQAADEHDSDDESCSECENEVSDSYDDNLASDVEESGGRRYRVVGDGPSARVVEVDSDDDAAPQEKLDKLPAGAEGDGDAGKVRQFSEEELLIASPVVLGFSFTEKDWFEFSLSGISDIVWNEGAFDSLVLPAAHKNIVKAQVSSHKFHGTETIDDIIQGKGKGLVFVLHGPPGVGKTLTVSFHHEIWREGADGDRPRASPSSSSARCTPCPPATWARTRASSTSSTRSWTLRTRGARCCCWTRRTCSSSSASTRTSTGTRWSASSCGCWSTSRASCS
jgi:hypothetical protein